MANLTTQFQDIWYDAALPVLKEVAKNQYNFRDSKINKLFNVIPHDREIYQITGVSGLSPAVQRNQGEAFFEDSIVPTFSKTFTVLQYGLQKSVTREMIKLDKWGIVKDSIKSLADSIVYMKEALHAYHFNHAHDALVTGPDGKTFMATDHPLPKSGGTSSNRLSVGVDLSFECMRQLDLLYYNMLDDNGMKRMVKPKYLLVHPNDKFTAKQLLNSTHTPESANNAVNPIMDENYELCVWEHLDDADAVFLVSEPTSTGLVSINMTDYEVHDDFDTRTLTGYMIALTEIVSGFYDWRTAVSNGGGL